MHAPPRHTCPPATHTLHQAPPSPCMPPSPHMPPSPCMPPPLPCMLQFVTHAAFTMHAPHLCHTRPPPPPPDRRNDTRLWKHYLSATTVADGNKYLRTYLQTPPHRCNHRDLLCLLIIPCTPVDNTHCMSYHIPQNDHKPCNMFNIFQLTDSWPFYG